jgi:uncharacterized membrane protein YeaQ/YmgE (transglycosylase-associated protein family)
VLIFAAGSALCGLATSLPMLVGFRVIQGFGGAMMTPVGRLILLRSFPRASLVSAMNWMTIPAMIGPTVGPIVGGVLTSYASWRWVFYLNIPMGIIGAVLGFLLFENFRAPAPTRFDIGGFFIAAVGLFMFEFAIENLGRPMIAPWVGELFFPISLVIFYIYVRHARTSAAAPVLDLSLLKIKTFRIGTVTGGVCRMGLDATPFMLPLLFQVGFGLSAMQAGALDVFVDPRGDAGARRFAPVAALARVSPRAYRRRARCRRGHRGLCAAQRRHADLDRRRLRAALGLRAQHPIPGAQYDQLCRRALAAAVRSTSVSGVFQQLARGFGVALGRRCSRSSPAAITSRSAISASSSCLIALVPLISTFGFLRLDEDDGAEVSGHASHAAVEADDKAKQGAGC